MKFAFFDVDNTIYNGYTANDLFPYLKKSKRVEAIKKEYDKAVEDYRARVIDYNTASLKILDFFSISLKNLEFNEVEALVLQMLKDKKLVLNVWVKPVINFLKEKGFKIVLVSGGPDTIVSEIAKVSEADEFFATEIKMKDFVYLGEETQLLNEHRKSELIKTILKTGEENITLGFGDSTGDIPMLELTDHSFVVENDHHSEMIDYAHEKGWTVFKTADEVLSVLKKVLG